MDKITAIIVVKNNPTQLLRTIASVKDIVEKIIIIDIGIDKQLINNLKNNKKIKIIKLKEETPYVELIRDKIKKTADTEYVFFMDPDEEITPSLKKIIKTHYKNYDYIKIPRKNIIFGKWIKQSRWWPDYQIRVFKKNKVTWPSVIHQQPTALGKELLVDPKEELAIIHHNYENINQYFEKNLRYASSEAKYLFEKKQQLTFKETLKKSINEFISRYYAGKGYKDGIHGLILSFLQMFYYFFVYFYYLELKNFKNKEEKIEPDQFFKKGLKESLFWKSNKSLKEKIFSKII